MSFGFGFALPAYPLRGGGGNNPFNQSGPTLDLSFAGVVTNLSDPNGYTLTTDFIVPQYQVAAQYTIWETGVGLVDKTFGDIITFTRASSATFTGSNGLIQSATTNTPRFDYDPVTLAAKGLLIEEQRTNLFTYSERFDNAAWSANGLNTTGTPAWVNVTTAPDGTSTADKLIENSATSQHVIQQNAATAGTSVAVSVYFKAAERTQAHIRSGNAGVSSFFDLSAGTVLTQGAGQVASITPAGNGWYRCSVVFTSVSGTQQCLIGVASGGTNVYAGDGTSGIFIWGAQLEAGSFATSYIPTVASQVTRSADVASVNTLSPWYNATEGTLFADFSQNSPTGFTSRALSASDGTVNNSIQVALVSSGLQGYGEIRVANVAVMSSVNGTVTAGGLARIALGYKLNDSAISTNGAAATVDTSVTLPTVDRINIGTNAAGISPINGHIRRITYYPRKLSSAELQAITA